MANISISEIYGNTQSQRIQNDDLFLMSLHNNSNDTYTTAGINGLQLKCNMVLPSVAYMNRFNHIQVQSKTFETGQLPSGEYIAYYQLTLPVDSYVHAWGEFILANKSSYEQLGNTPQWLSIEYSQLKFLTLNPQYGGYADSDNIIHNRNVSFWSGYARSGTKFVLVSVYENQSRRDLFMNNIHSDASYLNLTYFDASQNS